MVDFLKQLNQEQGEAVAHEQGPLLIVAGAGTGKTTVLISRLLYLITEKKVDPDHILLMTFTEKAAQELIERADRALPYGYVNLWIHTFHGLGDHLLKQHGLDIGLNPDYDILSTTEQWILVKKNLDKFDLDYYRPLGNPDKFISELLRHFSRLKDENVSPQQYLDYVLELQQDQDAMLSAAESAKADTDSLAELANAYHVYNQLLVDNKLLDFGDLITYTLKLFKERPNILQYYQQKWQYIMVDEFQDTNWSQYELVKLLSLPNNNLVAVGDDDQSIFKFRGASLSNIMQFKDDYPTAKEIVLVRNYRSSQIILDHAYQFIQHNNPNRLEEQLKINKAIQSQALPTGEIAYLSWPHVLSETQGVVSMIKQLHDAGQATWSDMTILIRANNTADRFIAELKRQGLPHQFISLRGLYYKKIILDILAYLKLLDNYHESAALLRVLDMPSWQINHLDIINLSRYARQHLLSLYEAMEQASAIRAITEPAQTSIKKLLQLIKQHTALAKESRMSNLYVAIVKDLFLPYLDQDAQREDFDYLNQFYRKVLRFEQSNPQGLLPDFRQLLDWELAAGDSGALQLIFEDSDTVKIITVHSAKGLEFKYVWLVDLVDKRFPTISRSDRIPVPEALVKERLTIGDFHLEEERRLFYVAMTRAKQGLYLTGARDQGGATLKKPSRFIAEANLPVRELAVSASTNELDRDLQAVAVVHSRPEYKAPDRFSFSQLETFNLCPWRYKYEHILQIPLPPKATTVFGRVMHNTVRAFLQPLLPGQPQQADLFGQPIATPDLSWVRLEKLYAEYWQDNGFADRQEADKYQKQGRLSLQNWLKALIANPWPKIEMLEKSFIWKIKDCSLVGAIDRVDRLSDGSLAIIDYKTGNPKDRLGLDDKKQLLIYQLALEQIIQQPVTQLAYYYLTDNSQQSFTAKSAELDKTRDYVLETIERIKKFDFTPTPGHACQFCDFRNICEFRHI
ncbi:MAG: UvrD-helicase domain-containing protein [bacterium]